MGAEADAVSNQLNGVTTTSGGSSGKQPLNVWVNSSGTYDSYGSYSGYSAKGVQGKKVVKSSTDLQNEIYGLAGSNPTAYMGVASNLYKIGALYSMRLAPNVNSVATALERAVTMYHYGNHKVSFSEWLDQSAQANMRAALGGSSGGGGGGGGYSGPTTTKSVSVTDAVSAEGLLQQSAEKMVGRHLTGKEVKQYTGDLNRAERANPQVTVSNSGTGYSTSTTTTAPDKGELLRRILAKNGDFAENQIDTSVMDMFLSRIKEGQGVISG